MGTLKLYARNYMHPRFFHLPQLRNKLEKNSPTPTNKAKFEMFQPPPDPPTPAPPFAVSIGGEEVHTVGAVLILIFINMFVLVLYLSFSRYLIEWKLLHDLEHEATWV